MKSLDNDSRGELEVIYSQKDKMQKISDDMFALGQKYSKKALEADNAKAAKVHLIVAKEAYAMCLKTEKQITYQAEWHLVFLSQIEVELKRSALWHMYLEFCTNHGVDNLPKGEFFGELQRNNFSVTTRHGHVKVIPPTRKPPKLLEAAKVLNG